MYIIETSIIDRSFKGGIIMLRFDQRLIQIFLEARNQAIEMRNVDGISTIDLFTELVEDSESLVYSYLSEMNSEEEISAQLFELNEKFAKREDVEYSVPIEFTVSYFGSNEKGTIKTNITQQLYIYIEAANKLAESIEGDCIEAENLAMVIVQDPIKPIVKFLRMLHADIPELREELEFAYYYHFEEKQMDNSVPEEMAGYLSIFSGDDTILGRDKEIESAWNILLKKTKRNIIFVGDQGVGKTAIAKKMVAQIKNGTAPEEFKGFNIYALDVNAIVGGTKYRGEAEQRFAKLISFIKQRKNAILFIDEAHLILGAGGAEGTNTDLANALKPLLAGDESRVIAATTTKEYQQYFTKDPAIKRRFEKVIVEEPTIYEVYPMIKSKVKELSKFHNVKITHYMINFIALYAACFSTETKNPDRTLDLVDRSMVAAKRKKKGMVDKESVISNFKVNIELFNSISKKEKEAIAYHEAGHYIAFSFLPFLQKTVKPVVVSIYPAENYLGITVTEKRKNVFETRDKQAYIERIAALLAGGIAERMVNGKENDGISSDSEQATQIAKTLVTQTGFYNDFFYNLTSLETEKNIERQVEEIKKILAEAKEIATRVIQEYHKELETVVKVLMQKYVVSDEDLKKAMQEVTKSGKNKELVLT